MANKEFRVGFHVLVLTVFYVQVTNYDTLAKSMLGYFFKSWLQPFTKFVDVTI